MKSEESWNRRVALECAAQAWSGVNLRMTPEFDGTGKILGTADRMLAWLDNRGGEAAIRPEVPAEPPVDALAALHSFGQDAPPTTPEVQDITQALAQARQQFLGRNGGTLSREDVASAMRAVAEAPSASSSGPARNVPTEGDGSMSVPVYRFYRECVDPDCKSVYYWREDTRNETNRWSLWLGAPAEPEDGIDRWASLREYDEAKPGMRPPADTMTRLAPQQLRELDIPAETRYDTED